MASSNHDQDKAGGASEKRDSSDKLSEALEALIDEHGLSDGAKLFGTEFVALNNSGVSGSALLIQDGREVTVLIEATGLEPGQVHAQHIHGRPDADSQTPTILQDQDADGFVELAEGLATYGPVLLNLTTNPEEATEVPLGSAGHSGLVFPRADEDGEIHYRETFSFGDEATAEAIFNEIMPLENREIVLHGLTLRAGQGADGGPAPDEADGTAGYKGVLPVASGEIVQIDEPEELLSMTDLGDFGLAA